MPVHTRPRTHAHARRCRVYGLGLGGEGTEVFFSGCSAGGRGALFNLEYIPAMLPHAVQVRRSIAFCARDHCT